MSSLKRGKQTPCIYLMLVRWVKSRAYLVSNEASESDDRLEPQPGYACHVPTWSRLDPLDPSKLNLEAAHRLAQVCRGGGERVCLKRYFR